MRKNNDLIKNNIIIPILMKTNGFFEGKRCPEGWKRFGCSCYYKSTEKRIWYNSRSFCQKNGSDLVVVNSKEEQVGVFTLVPSSFFVKGNHDGENALRKNFFFLY
uniref:C-type lectin domain-containing protein n=1 Tax=Oryzias latipes TaxID=8090 RepID=A0A3B3HWU4_ORYLA